MLGEADVEQILKTTIYSMSENEKRSYISILIPNLDGGGAERVTVNLANGLVRNGDRVDIVVFERTGVLLNKVSKDVNVVSLNASRLRKGLKPLRDYLIKNQPDSLLANMWPVTVLAIFAKILSRVNTKVYVAEHSVWSSSELLRGPLMRWKISKSMRALFPLANGIITVSHGAADDLATFANIERKAITVINNPLTQEQREIEPIERLPQKWWSGPHRRIIAIGTLKPIKRFDILLKAFSLACKEIDTRLLILGEGALRPELEKQIYQLNLQEKVFLHGYESNIRPYLNRAELLVLTSESEGFGNVIVEALAEGTPVVSTDCPHGPREILKDGEYGTLVPVNDIEKISLAIINSLSEDHNKTRLKMRGNEFSIDLAVKKYHDLLTGY